MKISCYSTILKRVLAILLIVNITIYPPGHVKSYPQLHESMWLIAVLKMISFKIIVISLILMDIVKIVLRGNTFMVPKGG